MTTQRRITLEQALFSLAFLLALVLRFLNLGMQPLTDLEAKWAIQAAEIARGSNPLLGDHPAYLLLTAVNFFLFGTSNFMARFWPALAGAGLVLVPAAFQKQLGRKAAILLAFLLVFDPGMLAVSRMAGSQMMAVGFMGLCLAAWQSRRHKLAGALGGVALLCGPAAWFGVLGLGLTWFIINFTSGRKKAGPIHENEDVTNDLEPVPALAENNLRTSLVWGVGSLLLVGTLLFLVPNGLSAWAGSIAEFITGWWSPGRLSLWIFPVTLLMYVPVALIFGAVGLVRGIRNHDLITNKLGILAGIYFLMAFAYPAHKTSDLIWMLVPVWGLAALELSRYLEIDLVKKPEVAIASVITFTFMVFVWLDLVSISSSFYDPSIIRSRLLLLLGALLIMTLSMFLVAALWDEKVAGLGIVWGGTIALMLYTVSAGFNSAGFRLPYSAELWQPSSQFVQADLLERTVKDLSVWRRGQTKSMAITATNDLNSPALQWLLRDWHVEQVDALSIDTSPELVILPQGVELKISSAYRGQDFVLSKKPIWDDLPLDGWLRWIAYRKIPEQTEIVVLWARNDLFLDVGAELDSSVP